MAVTNKNEAILLFVGDLFFFFLSLGLMLLVRFGGVPTITVFLEHLLPFSIIFVFWVIVFFISGLYEKHTLLLKSRIPTIILNAQLINSGIAVLFFYLIPFFGITPKTNLFVYILISFGLILAWRIRGVSILSARAREKAILIGSGEVVNELREEVNNNPRYGLFFVAAVDLVQASGNFEKIIIEEINNKNIQVVAADFKDSKIEPMLPNLYSLIFSKVRFIDMYKIYEDIFDRVPMSLVKYNWFLENVSFQSNKINDSIKRLTDVVVSVVIGLFSLTLYPFVITAILIEGSGPIFFIQDRVGKNNKIFSVYKFRSMKAHAEADGIAKDAIVTKVGNFLRKTRIDELPQIWNVLMGDLSLIGPRPEIPTLAQVYENRIPYYNVRHLIKPGLSGWAQLYQRTPPKWSADLEETKLKLSYDLYYLKNRSFMLDLKIGLKTIKTLFSMVGI